MTVHQLDRDAAIACLLVMDFVFYFGIKIAWDEIMMVEPRIGLAKQTSGRKQQIDYSV